MATTDRRFGELMEELDRSGKLKDTTVILTADHGESFEGGIYQHQTPYLTRPVIHIPLVVHAPGQTEGRTIDAPVDQTSLAPTILELAGQTKPEWMRGQSVAPWITGNAQPPASGMAFCQYLERNSIFKPLRKGTLGVIDGEYQYVVYLDNQNGDLRPLPQAQYWNINQGDQNPGKAASLRAAIQAQFPDLVT
jgi:arylsulfatase A-like enzyme